MPCGTKFASTDHCGVIKILDANINPYYLAYTLEENRHRYGFDRGLRASLTNMRSVRLSIPVDSSGSFDIKAQASIADAMLGMRQVRDTVSEKRKNIESVNIILEDENFRYKYLPLPELFETAKGLSKYTKKYGNLHSGPYPVYSASSQKPLTYLDTFDYSGRYMTWSTNGFAGTILILDGTFSINGDRGIFLPKDGRTDVDFDYMKFTLEPIFRELARGRKGDNGEDEFTKLYPSMLNDIMVPMPVDSDGNISLAAQKEIVGKYLMVEQCREEVLKKLDILINQTISL